MKLISATLLLLLSILNSYSSLGQNRPDSTSGLLDAKNTIYLSVAGITGTSLNQERLLKLKHHKHSLIGRIGICAGITANIFFLDLVQC